MHAYFANIGIFFDNMAHFESWQRLRIIAAVVNEDKVLSDVKKNNLLQIRRRFSRIDFFSKKECTGRTRLMKKEI